MYCSSACKQTAYRERKVSTNIAMKPFVLKVGSHHKELLDSFSGYTVSAECDVEKGTAKYSVLCRRTPLEELFRFGYGKRHPRSKTRLDFVVEGVTDIIDDCI
jgi:hypothetical protein